MPRMPFIVVFCGRHRYCFVYAKGQEEEVLATMIRYATDERFNFGWAELRSITRHLQAKTATRPDAPAAEEGPSAA